MTMLLGRLVEVVHRVRATSRKSEKTALIASLLREGQGPEIALGALYLSGSLPQGRIGVGWATLRDISSAGDAGPAEPLSVLEVDRVFTQAKEQRGAGASAGRARLIGGLFARASEAERSFLGELLMGEIRQGALDGIVQDAIARASGVGLAEVRRAAMFAENLGQVAQAAVADGAPALGHFAMKLLSPVAPMLASPARDVAECLDRLGEAAFEYKVDGARIQVHRAGDAVRVFTRQLLDVTARVPEVVEWALALPVREAAFDGEAVALRPDARPHPFQVTMRRFGRSKGVDAVRGELPLTPFVFDCLYLEGEGPLLEAPYAERARRLARIAPAASLLPRLVTADRATAEAFLKASLDAGQRGFQWLKLKAAQTLDLVVLAVEWGSGRRKGWLSNLHLGARDPAGGFVMLGKTFKGLTDEMLRWQTGKLLALETHRDDWTVYVRPELVVEIAFSDIQVSPRYPSGMALRFARVKRYREDKLATEADTVDTVRAILRAPPSMH